MYVIMGAGGHVGSAVADTLLTRGDAVTIVTHDAAHEAAWRAKGAEVAMADVNDVPSLRSAFRRGRRAFLLNPPADTSTDTDSVERETVAGILAALDGSGLEKVVAASVAGARPGERIGDLGILWTLEEGLRRQSIPAAINRAVYYMSNWDELLDAAKGGTLPTLYPADMKLPMIAPRDLGKAAADRLMSPLDDVGPRYVEGPARYSADDVAAAFAEALGRPVEVVVTPRDQWQESYRKLGFSEAAAASYAGMAAVSIDSGFEPPDDPIRGTTTLQAYIRNLVQRT